MGIMQSSDLHVPWLLLHLSPPALKRARAIWCERILFLLSLLSSSQPCIPWAGLFFWYQTHHGWGGGMVPWGCTVPAHWINVCAVLCVSFQLRQGSQRNNWWNMTQIKIHARPISGNVEGKIEGAMLSVPAKSTGIWKGGIQVKPINKPCDHLIVTQNTFYSRPAHITCKESKAELRTQADPRCELQNPSYSYTEQHPS